MLIAKEEWTKKHPKDAKIVKSHLKYKGVDDNEPRVRLFRFLELWYSYVIDVLKINIHKCIKT